jgi:hypothetical protein
MRMTSSSHVSLKVRQQPLSALVTLDGKEKSKLSTRKTTESFTDLPTARKPIDPPPIVEIKVRSDMDPYKFVAYSRLEEHELQCWLLFRHYLVSPYFFMYATLLPHDPNNPHAEEQGEDRQRHPGAMLGQLCSSLHRLKDVDNQGEKAISNTLPWLLALTLGLATDGGFFIFGDLSVRKLGWHKLRFALYDVSKWVCWSPSTLFRKTDAI